MTSIPNFLLASLPRKTYQQILPDLVPVNLAFGAVLFEPGKSMRDIYFPGASLVSLLTEVKGHPPLEVGMVGREGMVGVPLALGIDRSMVRALVQGGGPAMRMSRARFVAAFRASPPLQKFVLRYVHALMGQITQTAVCNRFHPVDARLSRWLLMTRDRVMAADFRMTHEFLASMLGVRREGVTEAASVFQRRGLIEYSRGNITILEHAGLEAAACSCYREAAALPDAVPAWRPSRRAIRAV